MARVQVDVVVEGRAEAVDEGDGAEPWARNSRRVVVTCRDRRRNQQSLYSSRENPRERGDDLGPVGAEASRSPAGAPAPARAPSLAEPPSLGHQNHPLPDGHRRDHVIDSGVQPSAPCVSHCTTGRRLFPCTRTPP